MIVITLEKTLKESTPAWRNFVRHVREEYINEHPFVSWNLVANDILNRKIEEYNGRYDHVPFHNDDKPKLSFETEQDYLAWTLKWT